MPWEEVTVMGQKKDFIEQYLAKNCSMTALCKRFSISRKTGYQLINRYEELGLSSLEPISRKPHFSPHKTSIEIENIVLTLRDKHPRWGSVKIRAILLAEGMIELPSAQTINAILKRHGRITEAESEKHRPWIRFEHEAPNDLWQIDFKGFFELTNKNRCYPLTLLDDHSRYCLLIKACSNQTTDTVQSALTDVFRKVGIPKQMTMDNGTPWGYSGKQLHTQFCAWLMRLGITVKHSRPNHPQTQGKLERFHRTLKEELLSAYQFDHLEHAQEGFDWWLDIYNYKRPHGAIELATPSTRYKPSDRRYIEHSKPYIYPDDIETYRVSVGGFINYKNKRYRVGEGFRGEHVGLVPEDNNLATIFYCHQKILTLDLNNVC
jgi:transposase InsO family protein